MSISFLDGALRSSTCAGKSISTPTTGTCSARLVNMLRADTAPDVLNMLFLVSMVVTQQPSLCRDKFDLQIVNAGLGEIDDSQNAFIVQTVVCGQEQHVLFGGATAQGLR